MIEQELVSFILWVSGCEIILAVVFIWFGMKIFKLNDDINGKTYEIDFVNHKYSELKIAYERLVEENNRLKQVIDEREKTVYKE